MGRSTESEIVLPLKNKSWPLYVLEYDFQGQIQDQQSLLSDDLNSFYRGNFIDISDWLLTNTNMKSPKRELDL